MFACFCRFGKPVAGSRRCYRIWCVPIMCWPGALRRPEIIPAIGMHQVHSRQICVRLCIKSWSAGQTPVAVTCQSTPAACLLLIDYVSIAQQVSTGLPPNFVAVISALCADALGRARTQSFSSKMRMI